MKERGAQIMKNEELKDKKYIYCLNGLTYILVTIFLFLAISHFICTDKYEIHGYFVISILFVLNILAMIFDYLKFRTVQKKNIIITLSIKCLAK